MRKQAAKEFEEAYTRYSDELFRHCQLRLSDRDRALEITQEAFMKTWAYMQKGNEVAQIRPFLYRTLKNLIIDEYRRTRPTSLEALGEATESGTIESLLPSDDSNTLEAAVGRFEGAHALRMLEQLPDAYREVLVMRYVEELSPKEIAESLGESENAVSVRVHRGLKKLKELLEIDPNINVI